METGEHRRQLQADEERVARGLNAMAPNGDQLVSLIRVLREKVRLSVERRSVEPLMEFVYANLSAGTHSVAGVPIACGRGCAFCCHSWIEATAPEVLFTVQKLPKSRREEVKHAVDSACSRTEGITAAGRLKLAVPCPLLEHGACSIYEIRPVACRLAVSASSEVCRRAFLEQSGESIPVPAPWGPIRQGYRIALEAALLNAGLDWKTTEWNSALRFALEDDAAEGASLKGERVFAPLQRLERTSVFEAPSWAGLYAAAFGEAPPLA